MDEGIFTISVSFDSIISKESEWLIKVGSRGKPNNLL